MANDHGVIHPNLEVTGFTLYGSMPVAGRALVVHQADSGRAGCGVISLGGPSLGGDTLSAKVSLATLCPRPSPYQGPRPRPLPSCPSPP